MRNFIFLFALVLFGLSQNISNAQQTCEVHIYVESNACGEARLFAFANMPAHPNCYTWNPGSSNNAYLNVTQSGWYTVNVICSNGGETSGTVYVNVAPPCNYNLDITETKVCGKSTICATYVAGATYTWNHNGQMSRCVDVMTSGNYSVTMKVGSFDVTASRYVSINNGPSVQIQGNSSFCEGEYTTLTATATGSTNCRYLWNTGSTSQSITVNTTGNYSVTVTDGNGCTGSATISVTKLQREQTPTISVKEVQGGFLLTAFPPSANYMWNNGSTGPSVTVKYDSPVKILTVKVKNSQGCWSQESCPVPVMFGAGDTGCTNCGDNGSGCSKTGITTTNNMQYGAVITRSQISSQDRIKSPVGATEWIWDGIKLNKSSILIGTAIKSHHYTLEAKINGVWKCYEFVYTIVNGFSGGNDDSSSKPSSVEGDIMHPSEMMEEELELEEQEIETLSNIGTYLTNGSYMTSPAVWNKEDVNVYPNPTPGPVRIEADLDISHLPNQIYFLTLTDPMGKIVFSKQIGKID